MPWKNKAAREKYLKKYRQTHQEHLRQYFQNYRQENREETNRNSRAARLKIKIQAFNAYGGCICCWCKESDVVVLNIDHLDNNGSKYKDRAGYRMAGTRIYTWLKKNKYPPGYQVLCFNCNYAKACNGGKLPENRYDLHLKPPTNIPSTEG